MNTCFECGYEDKHFHDHHVVPKSRGGTQTVPLCESCHSKAHHRDKNMNTSRLTREGLMRKKETGMIYGKIPFGFQEGPNRSLRRDKYESRIIADVTAWKLWDKITWCECADRLNAAERFNRTGAAWSIQNLSQVIKRTEGYRIIKEKQKYITMLKIEDKQ